MYCKLAPMIAQSPAPTAAFPSNGAGPVLQTSCDLANTNSVVSFVVVCPSAFRPLHLTFPFSVEKSRLVAFWESHSVRFAFLTLQNPRSVFPTSTRTLLEMLPNAIFLPDGSLSRKASRPKYLLTVWNVGYKFAEQLISQLVAEAPYCDLLICQMGLTTLPAINSHCCGYRPNSFISLSR